jgi:hypothetical protein
MPLLIFTTVPGNSLGSTRLPIQWIFLSHYATWRRLGERRHSSYSFSTLALDGGEWSASHPGRALSRGKDPLYPLYRRLGGPQSRSGHRGLCRVSNRDRPVFHPVARHYTDWATLLTIQWIPRTTFPGVMRPYRQPAYLVKKLRLGLASSVFSRLEYGFKILWWYD